MEPQTYAIIGIVFVFVLGLALALYFGYKADHKKMIPVTPVAPPKTNPDSKKSPDPKKKPDPKKPPALEAMGAPVAPASSACLSRGMRCHMSGSSGSCCGSDECRDNVCVESCRPGGYQCSASSDCCSRSCMSGKCAETLPGPGFDPSLQPNVDEKTAEEEQKEFEDQQARMARDWEKSCEQRPGDPACHTASELMQQPYGHPHPDQHSSEYFMN